LIFFLAFMMPGCSSHGVYPGDWAGLSPDGVVGCPSLAGDYWNAGERAVPEGGSPQYAPPYLSSFFFADTAAAARANGLRISGDANAGLTISLRGGDALPAPLDLRRQTHYRCEDGWLLLESSRWLAENVSGFESMTYRLRKANDGAIVVQVHASAVGVVFLVPVAGSSIEWYRFLPAE
jgi:hypothetical protein